LVGLSLLPVSESSVEEDEAIFADEEEMAFSEEEPHDSFMM
jgi:hypothetical protein